jgi:hypothetical protein
MNEDEIFRDQVATKRDVFLDYAIELMKHLDQMNYRDTTGRPLKHHGAYSDASMAWNAYMNLKRRGRI